MSDPRPLRPGRGGRPSPASLGVVRVDADFQDEYPGGDTTCTEAYAALCRTGEALLGELDRRIALTFDMHQAAATAQLLPGIRAIERSIMSALTQDERAHLLDLLTKVLARAAEVAAEPPEPLKGQRIRPARLDRPR
jgi:hypothetical protein